MNLTKQKTSYTRALPFTIAPQTWDGLTPDIRRLLWQGWSLTLQLQDLAFILKHTREVAEARRTGLIKPVAPLTPAAAVKRQQKLDGQAARLQVAKRAAADKISRLTQKLADEGETAGP